MQIEENIKIAFRGLIDHKLRSFLTMLGIIFGVASVIAMLSIGEGAKNQAIAKYQDLGVNNIIVREISLSDQELEETRAKFSQGLSLKDGESVLNIVPHVQSVAPQTERETKAQLNDQSVNATLIGITPSFKEILNYNVSEGEFIAAHHQSFATKVCVLGSQVAKVLFPYESAVGKQVKIEDQWLEVVGVLERKAVFTETVGELASRDLNFDIYIPLNTFLDRFPPENALASEIQQLTIQVEEGAPLMEIAEIIQKIVLRHHFGNEDFTMVIPVELLNQEEKERQIFNILLGSIAAISLLVGGIGIMNIMLASVMERTREIGIRRAIGAKRKTIMQQFITEAVVLSITGGIIGIILGFLLSVTITLSTSVETDITAYSVVIAFGFSILVGILFGYLPAKKAASLSPIESIRYE